MVLDDTGAEMVQAKKDWIRGIEPDSMWKVVPMSPASAASKATDHGEELPPATALYLAWATDMLNDSQTAQTKA